jgi:hypothetical protein
VAALCVNSIKQRHREWLQKHLLHGQFTLDAAQPEANGRPHYSTPAGGHMYYIYKGWPASMNVHSTGAKWVLSTGFTPDRTTCLAHVAAAGAVPVGEAVWTCAKGSNKKGSKKKWVKRQLTVTELGSVAEVAEFERQAVESLWRQAAGLGPEATDVEIAATRERRDGMVRELFEKYDTDEDGFLDLASYREFLVGIKVWGDASYTDTKFAARWPAECESMGSDPADGISLAGFSVLYAKYRGAKLEADYVKAVATNPSSTQGFFPISNPCTGKCDWPERVCSADCKFEQGGDSACSLDTSVNDDAARALMVQGMRQRKQRQKSKGQRTKFLFFDHEDKRPPFYGHKGIATETVTGRHPLRKEAQIDYEYDSEGEWDEPEEGE